MKMARAASMERVAQPWAPRVFLPERRRRRRPFFSNAKGGAGDYFELQAASKKKINGKKY